MVAMESFIINNVIIIDYLQSNSSEWSAKNSLQIVLKSLICLVVGAEPYL